MLRTTLFSYGNTHDSTTVKVNPLNLARSIMLARHLNVSSLDGICPLGSARYILKIYAFEPLLLIFFPFYHARKSNPQPTFALDALKQSETARESSDLAAFFLTERSFTR